MLTIENIISLYTQGLETHLRQIPHPERLKGECLDTSPLVINIYLPAIESEEDYYITILHEFIHARDISLKEDAVETEALLTFQHTPYIVDFIFQLYPNLKRKIM